MYKTTLFDRYGPDGGNILKTMGYGLMVFGLCLVMFGAAGAKIGFSPFPLLAWVILCSAGAGALATLLGLMSSAFAGGAWKTLMVDGSSTPYKEQYSHQQALVMQGKVDEALASFEVFISQSPLGVDVRLRAAEVYAREARIPDRAAELFREVQRIPGVSASDDIYASHRLVDLLCGPLNDRGRAMGELRGIIDRYPDSLAAGHAREALAELAKPT